MSPEESQTLRNWFPNLYAPDFKFSCGDGWFNAILALSAELTRLESPPALHVKEKNGGLRFHVQGQANVPVMGAIRATEQATYRICEKCGNPAETKCTRCFNG